MFTRILACAMFLWCYSISTPVFSQSTGCTPADQTITRGEVFFNYGSATDAYSVRNRSSYSLGEPAIGIGISKEYNSQIGFWARFLIPPLAPGVTATQGDLLDRIQLSWSINPLGSQASDGFKIYRDGVFLASVDKKTTNFNDFNVIAGRPYNYEVRGINSYGEGISGKALGFQVPNGVVTGWVRTLNDNPVPNALVTLMPMQGFSVKFGPTDGALADTTGTSEISLLPAVDNAWTITCWIKTQSATANAGILQLQPFPLNIRPVNSAGGQEGVSVDLGAATIMTANFPTATKNDWHHVAVTFAGGQYRLYIDGVLATLTNDSAIPSAINLNLGQRTGSAGTWTGRLDELRIYHLQLDELDLGEVMEGTASSLTPGLKTYWKMDEEQGEKSFDVIKRNKLFFCGAKFDKDRPAVRTAGKTNEQGYYRIESANYGTGITFLAEPMKNFYLHRALKFNRFMSDYATLPNFSVTPKSTLELWVNSGGPDGTQCLLSKKWSSNDFRLLLTPNGTDNDVKLYLNGQEHTFGTLGIRYQHLAFTIDSSGNNRTVTAYKNGVPFGTPYTFVGVTGNWSDPAQEWMVGARPSGVTQTDYYGGLVDEIALYDSTLSQPKILEHFQNSRNPQERGLRVYFAFDEGSGNRLNNAGSVLTGSGMGFGTTWTPQAPNQMTEPHVFAPKTRQVTLNPSVTSVDQVDFTDRSLVPVSGFIRYANTDCFAENVEILVNGESFSPKIFTDSTGKFVIDFEPGTTATLTPKYKDHTFFPASWDVTNVTSPIAGILFSDTKTRKIKGQIAGGLCRASIISGPAEDCRITVRTKDGCFEWVQLITATDGKYEFNPLPPLDVTIAITKHNNKKIYDDFQTQGGREISLVEKDSIGVDFIYIAPPTVGVEGLENYYTICKDPLNPTEPLKDADGNPLVIIEDGETVQLDIRVFEQYGVGQDPADRCLLDSAILSIDNTFDLNYDFLEPQVDTMRNKKFDYNFFAANPNPDPPFLQIMQITADVNGRKGTFVRRALITGIIKGEKKFTTVTPMLPSFVLRDPPGDGSYAYIEKGETICNTMESSNGGGGGLYFTTDLSVGPKTKIIPFFGVPILEITSLYGASGEFDLRVVKTTKTSMEYCMTATERISTDDGDLIVGAKTSFDGGQTLLAGNDVYVGTAFNFIISDSKLLTFDDVNCTVKLNTVTSAEPDSFATTYMYSEWNIENNVIRYLDSLILDGQDVNGTYAESKQRWLDYIKMNTEAKAKATFKKNISWDAGVQYEYSQTRDTAIQSSSDLTTKFEGFLGFITETEVTGIVGVKFNLKIGAKYEGTFSNSTGNSERRGTKVGYVLKDDDPGDNWTVDVKDDPVFKTPVFTIVAGQTSCPWEVGTAHREGMKLVSVDGNTRLNVPSNGEAAFKFQLQNNSQTGETFTYVLTTGPESNPHGAKIFLNGGPLDKYVAYAIPWGTTIPVTVTVERGPTEYFYDKVELVLVSECHDRRCNTLGFAGDFEPLLYSAVYLTVGFEEPCSEVDIAFPLNGWVVKPDPLNVAEQDNLPITVVGYDKKDADLLGIRLQYRPENGDGAWINITNQNLDNFIPKADLGDLFEEYKWNTGGMPALSDGPYEIRAISVCDGAPTDNSGYSHIIKGKIERQPPSIIGTPEPSDGVFNVGDEISFTFNKNINCATNKIDGVDNVLLFNTETGAPININITCKDNKLILDPKFANNETIENVVLRAELHGIEDLVGNTFNGTKANTGIWEFYVDRNELAWLTDSMGMTKFENEVKTGTAAIHNRGGYPVPFTITGAPSWVRVVPNKGTLVANQVLPISFEVDSSLAFGLWSDTITLHTETGQNPFFMGGDEKLPIGVRVVCRPPVWTVNPGAYENSMNMVLKLNIQGQFSTDGEDIVAAYINGTLRGRANVRYVPELNTYLAYLTVYGDPSDQLDDVRLEIWDASACLRYGSVVESFTFQPDNVIGIPNNPQVIHTSGLVLREVPFGYGWNWLSFNLAFPDNSINAALASLNHPENDLMKSQTSFSTYSGGWFGALTNLGNTTMYIYRAEVPDTLKMVGNLIDPATTNIPIVTGWNWIGYVPSYSLPINEALSSLPSQTGDLIKSQVAFAQYINPAFGWIGNLQYMQPPNGYQIKVATPGTLTYPPPGVNRPAEQLESRGGKEKPVAFWNVNPSQFEHSMTLIGMLKVNGQNATTATMELGVFAGTEVRGSALAIYIAPLNSYLFFLTSYANAGGEQLKFKLFDASTGAVQEISETMWFSPDLHQGSIESPVPFTLKTSGLAEAIVEQSFDVQPNPFTDQTMLRFALSHAQEVTISVADVSGREVSRLRSQARTGLNTVTWDGTSDAGLRLGSGVYFVRLNTEDGMVTRKVVLQR